jgi:hypothetical protein
MSPTSTSSFHNVLSYTMLCGTSMKRIIAYFCYNTREIIPWLILTIIILWPKPLTIPVVTLNGLVLNRSFFFWIQPSKTMGRFNTIPSQSGKFNSNSNKKGKNKYPNKIPVHLAHNGSVYPFMVRLLDFIR